MSVAPSVFLNGAGGLVFGNLAEDGPLAAPTLTHASVSNGEVTVSSSIPGTTRKVLLQVFSSASCASPQGRTLVGQAQRTRGVSGTLLSVPLAKVPTGQTLLTATLTNLSSLGELANTSLFSRCVHIGSFAPRR